jgi:RNA polymerase sigma-32 factor
MGGDIETVYKMETRLNAHDAPFDRATDAEDDKDYTDPSSYLSQPNADPAETLASDQWDMRRQERLRVALESLDERSRDIVSSRLWQDQEKLTLSDLAARYQVSAERIRSDISAMKKLNAS